MTMPTPLYIEVVPDRYAVIRIDRVADEQLVTVYNVPVSEIDTLIEKLQVFKRSLQDTNIIPVNPEPDEMTAVLGPKPESPAAWYEHALQNVTAHPEQSDLLSTRRPWERITEPPPPVPARKQGYGWLHYNDGDDYADIYPRKTIRIYGLRKQVKYDTDRHAAVTSYRPYDLTFNIGDTAVYGSFNLIYTGCITAIGEKTVKIESYGKTHQLKIAAFIFRNHDFNIDRISKENSEWMD